MTLLRQLQKDALDPNVDITTVLRKARVLAARLNNPEFVAWIQHELNGYYGRAAVPKYRVVHVEAVASLIIGLYRIPRASIMASQIPNEYRHWATTAELSGSISELASLCANPDKGIECRWSQELAIKYGGAGYGAGQRVQCLAAWQEISAAAVVGIIETVRNRLLEFVLQIEAEAPDAGEVAPGETPLPQERVTQIFNNYISGGVTHIAANDSSHVSSSVGSMTKSQIQQAGDHSVQALSFSQGSQQRTDLERLIREMSDHLDELALDEKNRRKADAQIRTIQAQLADDEPDLGTIAQAGATLRNVTEGAIGSLIATAAQPAVWHWVAQTIAVLFPS